MTKTFVFKFLFLAGVLEPTLGFSQSTPENLQRKLDYARWLKDRIENGQSPCQQDSCQLQKASILSQAFQKSEMLPSAFKQERSQAFEAAFNMIDDPWIRPESFFPESLRDWQAWWEHRFRDDAARANAWMSYSNELMRNYVGLDLLVDRFSSLSTSDRPLMSQALEMGALRIGFLLREAPMMMIEAERIERLGRIADAKLMQKRALELSIERETLEKKFKGEYEGVMKRLFPRTSFKQIVSAFHAGSRWMDVLRYSDIDNPALLKKLRYFRDVLKKIQNEVQSFNDLEFGVLGLKNFNASHNPLIAAQQEAIIQEYLDVVDAVGRTAASIASFYAAQSLMAGFTQSVFWRITPLAAASSWTVYHDFELEAFFWDNSTISGRLNSKIPQLEEETEKRFRDLLKAYQTVCNKIQELEMEIDLSEANNQHPEGVSL